MAERERRHSLHKANLKTKGVVIFALIETNVWSIYDRFAYVSPQRAVLNCSANVIVQFPHFFRLTQRTSYKQVYRTFSCHDWKNKVNSCLAIVSFRQRNNLLAKRTLVKRRVGETTNFACRHASSQLILLHHCTLLVIPWTFSEQDDLKRNF